MNSRKNEVLQVILDEPRLYIEESLGSVMIRGEVVVCFEKPTYIEGFIDLLFEGIQTYYPTKEEMKLKKLSSSIETKLQVVKLSLLPPNPEGLISPGFQRFPFEFPIPSSLPTSVEIPDRLIIQYQISAMIKCPRVEDASPRLLDWSNRNRGTKEEYVACRPMRIVRAMESIVSNGLINGGSESSSTPSSSVYDVTLSDSLIPDTSLGLTPHTDQQESLPWNRRNLDTYQRTFDEQHDLLAYSLAGRFVENFTHTSLENVQGVRFKIGVDRTAIALGTSVGIELMIEPTFVDCVIRSASLNIEESRTYSIKVPASDKTSSAYRTIPSKEKVKMIIKWGHGYDMNGEESGEKVNKTSSSKKGGSKYVQQKAFDSPELAYFDPPEPGSPHNKLFLKSNAAVKPSPSTSLNGKEEKTYSIPTNADGSNDSPSVEMINMKVLNQPVKVGEYFGGRFVMPMPDCSSFLHPSMNYETVKINHWLNLVVTIECNGRVFDIHLASPMHMLDCRLVAADDKCETILPPPPSYQGSESYPLIGSWPQSTFWEQRESITSVRGWGSCVPCPCKIRSGKVDPETHMVKGKKKNITSIYNKFSPSSSTKLNSPLTPSILTAIPTTELPEWGPSPSYSV
ncbi:hypothetical protein BDB01DRAFT_843995 [Pilobolus umbonatus]|nr:hypothetical protein BDB01DRAFT_843995 [Pilobolus umbonatus]